MLNVEIDDINGLAILTPDGPLSADDFVHVAAIIDPYIEKDGKLNGLIIATESFPGWDSFAALLSHIRFVRDHHRHVKKVALVTNSPFGDLAEDLAEHFVSAAVESFDFDELDAAKAWMIKDED